MTDKPIIFSAPMVRALIDGRKTQTRRALKPQPDTSSDPSGLGRWGTVNRYGYWRPAAEIRPVQPGDRLWVKEAVTWVSAWGWRYRADNDDLSEKREQGEVGLWRSPIFMPRRASRLTLPVTDVRVQRVQDISKVDAVAEGIERLVGSKGPNHFSRQICGRWSGSFNAPTAQEVYADLWNSLHAKPKPVKGPDGKVSHYVSYPWESVQETRTFRGLPWIVTGNPWIAAYTFTVRNGNIDGGQV